MELHNMASNTRLGILLPVGRIVEGSVHTPQTTDANGQPLVYKSGPKAGQPRSNIYFAVAIPKNAGETHWAYAKSVNPAIGDWGNKIYQFGAAAWPQGQYQNALFSWKITDGDDTTVNANGRRPCDKQGFAGHWIVKCSGEIPPKCVNNTGTEQYPADQINPGMFVQLYINIDSNGNLQKPGIYVNHSIVSFQGYGEPIVFGPDARTIGFGSEQLPAGASLTPIGGMAAPGLPPTGAPTTPGLPPVTHGAPALPGAALPPSGAGLPPVGAPAGLPPVGGAGLPPVGAPAGLPPVGNPAPSVPNPLPNNVPPVPGQSFTGQVLGQGAPVVPPAPQMTAQAGGLPYETFIQQGWTDALLRQHGYMV